MTSVKTSLTEMLLQANNIDPRGFQRWVFCPGMVYGSTDKWWGDFGQRDFPHEGIDLCLYEDRAGRLQRLDAQTRIPVMGDGVVRAVFRDYLGQAIIVEHASSANGNRKYLSVYAHTRPKEGLQPGVAVREGEVIATIADTRHAKARILPHLHLSLGHPSPTLVYALFVWNMMRDPERVALQDPMDFVEGRYRILDFEDRSCLDF